MSTGNRKRKGLKRARVDARRSVWNLRRLAFGSIDEGQVGAVLDALRAIAEDPESDAKERREAAVAWLDFTVGRASDFTDEPSDGSTQAAGATFTAVFGQAPQAVRVESDGRPPVLDAGADAGDRAPGGSP